MTRGGGGDAFCFQSLSASPLRQLPWEPGLIARGQQAGWEVKED